MKNNNSYRSSRPCQRADCRRRSRPDQDASLKTIVVRMLAFNGAYWSPATHRPPSFPRLVCSRRARVRYRPGLPEIIHQSGFIDRQNEYCIAVLILVLICKKCSISESIRHKWLLVKTEQASSLNNPIRFFIDSGAVMEFIPVCVHICTSSESNL